MVNASAFRAFFRAAGWHEQEYCIVNSVLKKGLTAAVAAATLGTIAAPADARHYRRHYYDRDNDAALAIGAGIIGLGLGAAIASSNRGYYDPYYGSGYYAPRYGYGYGPSYGYGYHPGYYNRGYYGPRCYTRRVYDPYIGRRVRVRYCD